MSRALASQLSYQLSAVSRQWKSFYAPRLTLDAQRSTRLTPRYPECYVSHEMEKAHAVEMLGITKQFPGVLANDKVDFRTAWGEVHALIGENGAGKTTLMNILYGLHHPDSGEIRVSGQTVEIVTPRDAIAQGIGMVHQHFMLVPAFTALENIILGAEPTKQGRTDYHSAEAKVRDICERFSLHVDLKLKVADLSVSAQQKVEILKALYRNARILILDEPTSVLAPQEAESLFDMLRRMASEGMCIILISHKLQDVMSYSDRVTVLRQGKSIVCMETAYTNPEELAKLMVGTKMKAVSQEGRTPSEGPPILTVRDLSIIRDSGVPAVDSISFEVHPGEILGIAGVDGNGQRELAEALVGLRKSSGGILLEGRELLGLDVQRRLQAGIAYVPEDRRFAMIFDCSVQENAVLGMHRGFARRGMLNLDAIRAHASALIERFDVRTSGTGTAARHLSGGNQQKLVLGRALCREPRLLIACQPTRGLDVNAASEVHRHLLAECGRGAGVLLISYDLDEILSLSDRILVMYQGRVAGILSRGEANRENVGALMVGAAASER